VRLEELRNKIDQIDDKILDLYNERMEIVHKIGELKNTTHAPIYRPERELSILTRLKERNANQNGRLTDSAIDALFLELFAVARNLELPEAVAYLGPEASFTHQAAEIKFGATSTYIPISSIEGVFREVSKGRAKFGVVPIENSSNGIVSDTIRGLDEHDLKIVAEVMIDVHLAFGSLNDKIQDIHTIYSKDIAFEQCRNFIQDLALDEISLVSVESTAKAAKLAIENPNTAAISPEIAMKMYNLPVRFKNIEDNSDNRTRFFIISDFENGPSGNDKTSLLVKLCNKPGSLVEFLNDFEASNINLTKIKSHIVGGESIFFIECNGHKEDKEMQEIFVKHKNSIKILGSYIKEVEDI